MFADIISRDQPALPGQLYHFLGVKGFPVVDARSSYNKYIAISILMLMNGIIYSVSVWNSGVIALDRLLASYTANWNGT